MTVDANVPASEDLFGKVVSDLQSNVSVGASGITGTLKYVSNYTGFSSKTSEQSGNYLAIHCTVPSANDATITVEVVNGTAGERTLEADGLIVLRIADKTTQSIRVKAKKTGLDTVTKTFNLTGLTLESA